jgi:hypothetical protein
MALLVAQTSQLDLVLTLGAVVLRTSEDHEAAIRLREDIPILGLLGWPRMRLRSL